MSRNPAQLSVELQGLFPPEVVVAESREVGDPSLLMPEEAEYLGRAVFKRVQEFAAGRCCGRRALAEFGIHGYALRVAEDRLPVWPPGIVGSISHTSGWCAAAIAERRHILSLGLDCEGVAAVPVDLWSTICLPRELEWIHSLALTDRAAAASVIFSAKEAFYKCQYPITREWLDFHDVLIEPLAWDGKQAGFSVNTVRRIALDGYARLPLAGKYLVQEQFVAAAVSLAAEGGAIPRLTDGVASTP